MADGLVTLVEKTLGVSEDLFRKSFERAERGHAATTSATARSYV